MRADYSNDMREAALYAPVVIPTCNRYEHLKLCIQSLQNCMHAEKTDIYISVDYPPNETYEEGWNKIISYVKEIKGFRKVHVWYQETNLGAIRNSMYAINAVFEKCRYIVFSEDDNIFAPAFLDYMNKMLRMYENDLKVQSISGFSLAQMKNKSPIYKRHEVIPWGYGLWKEKWYSLCMINQIDIYNKYCKSIYKVAYLYFVDKWSFCGYVARLINRIEDAGMCDSTQTLLFYLLGYYSISPAKSLVKNIGFDGTGQSCKEGSVPQIDEVELYSNKEFDVDEKKRVPILTKRTFPTPEWARKSSKLGNDPLTFLLYRFMGREKYLQWRNKKGF